MSTPFIPTPAPTTAPRMGSRPQRDTSGDIAVLVLAPPALVDALYEEALRQVARWVGNGVAAALAETAAYDNIEQALAYRAKKQMPLHGRTPAENERIRAESLRLYRWCVKRDVVRDKVRAAARDGGSLDAPLYGDVATATGDTVAAPGPADGLPFDPNDVYGGWFGRELHGLLYARYRPEQAEQLWRRFRHDLDWKDVASGQSADAVRRWGTRQMPALREALAHAAGVSQNASDPAFLYVPNTNDGKGTQTHVGH